MASIALLGSTGLVGRQCLELLADDRAFERIVVIARRKFGEATAPRIEGHVIDFDQLPAHADVLAVDQVICALGTTIKAVGGSQERFRAVDYGIPLAAAQIALRKGARHFLLVSAVGADAGSRIFYNRVKGELEDALRTLRFRSVTIVRPSLLLGDREEFRLGEVVAKRFAWAVPGKYRPVHARDVAKALVRSAREDVPGLHIIESEDIPAYAAGQLIHAE
jgi:uncharacterized protein YbjT (DUF2867 family)